jgi:hypothetical protein
LGHVHEGECVAAEQLTRIEESQLDGTVARNLFFGESRSGEQLMRRLLTVDKSAQE